ncbi:integral membrane protein TerC [Candidatus Magnetoovum chiemensis]|nr:integral membrane protein TerC [Candidatus Magnetoovum chiemensis]
MDILLDPQSWLALITLTALEIVLGIDNIIFVSIVVEKLPAESQKKARFIGLSLAMIMRIGLLLSLAWLMRLTSPIFTVMGNEISGRDLILLVGGLFLMFKATHEIHEKIEGHEESGQHETSANNKGSSSFTSVIIQIILLDIVFSLDSVITAIGMAQKVIIMVIAIVVAVGFMLISVNAVSGFIKHHPTIKMLALSFLILIGVALIGEGLEFHIPKGYIYFAMSFSLLVEFLNMKTRKHSKSVSERAS